jgi:antitoxin component YwqK of YwqJK toxin-antitoxin module
MKNTLKLSILLYIIFFSSFVVFAEKELKLVETKYPNGKVNETYYLCKGESDSLVRQGQYTRWYDDGKKLEEGFYINGKKDGLWIELYQNGQKKSEVNWKNGVLNGNYISRQNGAIWESGECKDGFKEGKWIFAGGMKGEYKKGKKHGRWIEKYLTDRPISCRAVGVYIDDQRDGEWLEECSNFNQGGKVHARILTYDKGKLMKEIPLRRIEIKYPSGNIKEIYYGYLRVPSFKIVLPQIPSQV